MLNKEYILECLDKYCTFDKSLSSGEFYSMIVSPLENAKCFEEGTWYYDSGATKGVLIFDELDFVIKIPFFCEYLEDEGYYDSEDRWISDAGPASWSFQGVSVEGFTHKNEWDYCETESYFYLNAKKAGVEKYFAETCFLDNAQGWPVYTQQRACMFRSPNRKESCKNVNYSEQQRKTAKTIRNEKHFFVNEEWILDFLVCYGEESLMKLITFCDDNLIEDLHDGNIGYIQGAPCLVDYSCFIG